jgi:hypothetical protein
MKLHTRVCVLCVCRASLFTPIPIGGGIVAENYRLCMSVHGLVELWMHTSLFVEEWRKGGGGEISES